MTAQVMIDLETLGKKPGSVILSIGAVKFDMATINDPDHPLDRFHVAIDPESCQEIGLTIDAGTVMWWMDDQRDEARQNLMGHEQLDIGSALYGFAEWFGPESLPVWGNSAAFDNEILKAAFEAASMEVPWKFWDDRCYRTLKSLYPGVKIDRSGTYHNALDDAISQTKHLIDIVDHAGIEL